MHAAHVPSYGTPDVLELTELPRPEAGPGQLVVEVLASPVTQGDRRLRSGDFPGITWLPGRLMMGLTGPRQDVPGSMFAGRVAEVGEGVQRFAVGDLVFGETSSGAHAEYLRLEEDGNIAPMPAGLSPAEAAALPYGGFTALHFLSTLGQVQPDERVLVIGAAGGVGRMAVQIARHLGAEVTAVCASRDQPMVRSLGAAHFIDHHQMDFHETEARFDVILDPIGASTFARSRRLLTDDGRYLALHVTPALLLQMALQDSDAGKRAFTGVAMPDRDGIETVRHLAEQGVLRPVLDRSFPLARVGEAHAWLESQRPKGTVILEVKRQVAAA